jgi:hypothetical protein
MTDYVKSTNFASKDSLSIGNPLKIVKGTEIDTEFNNIATAVATKADIANPTFTGVPAAPTASSGTNTTQLATTAFVTDAVAVGKINTALTGVPTAPTAAVNTNTTQVATTAFVTAQIADDAPTKTGTGASGTWGINITGNAATATTDSQHLGMSQTWQVVSGSRALGTTYTNSTGKPIQVSVTATSGISGSIDPQLTVGGVVVARQYQVPPSGFSAVGTVSAIVPTGTAYSATATGAVSWTWQELR